MVSEISCCHWIAFKIPPAYRTHELRPCAQACSGTEIINLFISLFEPAETLIYIRVSSPSAEQGKPQAFLSPQAPNLKGYVALKIKH